MRVGIEVQRVALSKCSTRFLSIPMLTRGFKWLWGLGLSPGCLPRGGGKALWNSILLCFARFSNSPPALQHYL